MILSHIINQAFWIGFVALLGVAIVAGFISGWQPCGKPTCNLT